MPAFPLGRDAGARSTRRTQARHGQQQSQMFLLAPRQDGQSKVGVAARHLVLGQPMCCFLVDVANMTCLGKSFPGHSGHIADPT